MAVMSAGVAFVRSPSQDAASQGLPPSPRPSLFSGSFRDGGPSRQFPQFWSVFGNRAREPSPGSCASHPPAEPRARKPLQ